MSGHRTATRLAATLLVLAGVGIALATAWPGNEGERTDPEVLVAKRATGAISMTNSRAGHAVLAADDLVPGGSVDGSVVIGNRGNIPMRLHVRGDAAADAALSEALQLSVYTGSTKVYAGSLSGLDSAAGVIQPDSQRRYRFEVKLPDSAGNSLQGSSTMLDITWRGKNAAPPPACRIRALRSRFFIFKRRHRIRMVVRYRSSRAARVSLIFFERLPGDRRGRQVGGFATRIRPAVEHWRIDRFARRRSLHVLDRLRSSRRGFIVQVRVKGAPDYCARRMNLVLTQLRRVDRQFVWFQRGSFRRMSSTGLR